MPNKNDIVFQQRDSNNTKFVERVFSGSNLYIRTDENGVLTSSSELSASYASTASYIGGISGDLYYSGSNISASNLYVDNQTYVNYIDFEPRIDPDVPVHSNGRMFYDQENGSLTFYNDEADISLQIGQEFYLRVQNRTGDEITNGTPVFISGSTGDQPEIHKAVAEDHTTVMEKNNHIIGVATHTILNNESGYVTTQGLVRNIDTTAFSPGDILYVSSSAGQLTNIRPEHPYDIIRVGYVVRSMNNGFIYVHTEEPVHFSNISGLSGSYNAHVGDLWVYQSNNAWTHTKQLQDITASSANINTLQLNTSPTIPANSNDSAGGIENEIRVSGSYLYIYTGNPLTWKRVQLNEF